MTARILLFAYWAFVASAQNNNVCFGRSGNQDTSLGVCDPSAKISSCCSWGEICYSNGLCQRPGTVVNATHYTLYNVQGCTTSDGSTDECAAVGKCLDKGTGVTSCGSNTFCCYGLKGCDCNNSTQVFSLPAGTILKTLGAAPTSLSSTATKASRNPSSPPSTLASTTSASSATASASSTSSADTGSHTNVTAIGVGVGVGVGVAVLGTVVLSFYFWRRRKIQQALDWSYKPHHGANAKSAAYDPFANSHPERPESYMHMQHPAELDGVRSPTELQGSMKPPAEP